MLLKNCSDSKKLESLKTGIEPVTYWLTAKRAANCTTSALHVGMVPD